MLAKENVMSTAFVISMLAVAISLGAVFLSVRSRAAKAAKKKDGGDSGTATSSTSSNDDCGPADNGSCDGGGGD
jgi:uncharacterized membrane protein